MFPLAVLILAQPPAPDWAKAEHNYLHNITQVTKGFARAGEGYFSPDAKKVIFQAEEADTGNPFYQIFVQDLASGSFRRITNGTGYCTCPYFHPTTGRVIFGSSFADPAAKDKQAKELAQRAEDKAKGVRRRYSWDFDPAVKIYEADADGANVKCLTPDATTYTAECSYSADGKKVVFSQGTAGNVQLFTMNADGTGKKQLTNAPNCYNGGPFFSPDGTKVVFRADRKEKDRLQLYVIDADGTNEKALTDNSKWVFWAPYWYKDGVHIIYTAADHSDPAARPNYDVYWMNTKTGTTVRLTHAPGQDVLPVFSPDGTKMMWTSSRDGRGPTQLWIADFVPPTE